jgi:hypothetical protein
MARNGDKGPYHPDNVHKKTASENCREGQVGKPKSEEQKEKWRITYFSNKNKQKELI